MKKVKIKTSAAFVNDDGKAVDSGVEVIVTHEFLEAQQSLLQAFDMPLHEVIEEVEVPDETETQAAETGAETGNEAAKPETQAAETTPKGKKGAAKPETGDEV